MIKYIIGLLATVIILGSVALAVWYGYQHGFDALVSAIKFWELKQ